MQVSSTLMILQIFLNKKILIVKIQFLRYCNVYETSKFRFSFDFDLMTKMQKKILDLLFAKSDVS